MKMKMKQLKSKIYPFLKYTLVLSFIWSPLSAHTEGIENQAQDFSSQLQTNFFSNAQNAFMLSLANLQQQQFTNSSQVLPPKLNANQAKFMGLGIQKMLVRDRNNNYVPFKYGQSVFSLPTPQVSDISQVNISIHNGDIYFEHTKSKNVHVIESLNIVSLDRDAQFIHMISHEGELYSISIRFLKQFMFQSDVPVFAMGTIEAAKQKENLKIGVVHPLSSPTNLSPALEKNLKQSFTHKDQKIAFNEGDIYINSGDLTLDIIDREDLVATALASSKYLALLCLLNNPRGAETLTEIRQMLEMTPVEFEQIQAEIEKFQNIDLSSPENFHLLSSLNPYVFEKLIPYMQNVYTSLNSGDVRNRITLENAQKLRAQRDKELAEEKEFDQKHEETRNKLHHLGLQLKHQYDHFLKQTARSVEKSITKENILKISKVLAIVSGTAAIDYLTGEHLAVWATSFAAHFWHDVLPTYSDPVVGPRTLHAVLMLVPAPFMYLATGYLGSLITGLTRNQFLAKISFFTYGSVAGVFQILFSDLNLKNIVPTLRRGMDPLEIKFQKKRADQSMKEYFSDLMPYRNAFNIPIINTNNNMANNRFELEKKAVYELRLDNAAQLLARAILLKDEKIDIVSQAISEIELAKNRSQAFGVLEKKANQEISKDEMLQIEKLSLQIRSTLSDLNDPDIIEGLSKMSPDKIAEISSQAKNYLNTINQNPTVKGSIKRYSYKVLSYLRKTDLFFRQKLPRGAGVFFADASNELAHAEANDAIIKQNLRVFFVSYLNEILAGSVAGAYANMNKPNDLLGNPNGPFGINQSFFTQTVNSIIFLTFANPARMFLDFALSKDPTQFSPHESELIEPRVERADSFVNTGKNFAKNAFNLYKLNMGHYAIRHLIKTWQMIIPGIAMAVISRHYLGIQSLEASTIGEVWRMTTAFFPVGLMWAFETRNATLLDQEYQARAHKLKQTQYKINQGLSENNNEMTWNGVDELLKFYEAENKTPLVQRSEFMKNPNQLKENAQKLLIADLKHSVIGYRPNEYFMKAITLGMVYLGAEVASSYFKIVYDPKLSIGELLYNLENGIILMGKGFTTIWAVQKGINYAVDTYKEQKELKREQKIMMCRELFKLAPSN